MKSTPLIFGLLIALLLIGAHTVHAAAAGDPCATPNDPNECGGADAGLYCDTSLICKSVDGTHSSVPASYTPAGTTQTPSNSNASANSPSTAGTSNFVPLTNFPAVTDFASNLGKSDGGITSFLNTLYKVCIGLAATLAVLQIMYAGILWMSAGDNMESISKARRLIGGALFGLVLVLSPVIVFSLINPSILNLSLNFSALQVKPGTSTNPQTQPAAKNDLGQPDNCKNNEGGCTVAPTSKIDATVKTNSSGQTTAQTNPACPVVNNGQIIQDPNGTGSQLASCCAHEYSDVAECGVQARTNSDYSQTAYCGCNIKATAYLDYYNYYRSRSGSGPEKIGPAPAYQTRYKNLSTECTAAGGKLSDSSAFFPKYIPCPGNTGVPASTASVSYLCLSATLTCKSQ